MSSINKKCHQNVFLSIVQIMPGWLTYPRTTEAYLYYKLTYDPKGSGELINHNRSTALEWSEINYWVT